MDTERFSYHLPRHLIARYPLPRGTERLLVIERSSGRIFHRQFGDIVSYLKSGDVLVLNDTRVIPARLMGRKETGGSVEVFLLRELSPSQWKCLVRASKRMRQGMHVLFPGGLTARIEEKLDHEYIVSFSDPGRIFPAGRIPLPPYMERDAEEADADTYQTVYARHDGSVAAPTAGLHFTSEMLDTVSSSGTELVSITLHVGPGTFTPVRSNTVEGHTMHAEEYLVKEQAARKIREAMEQGRRIVAVGTTTTRVLEHLMRSKGGIVEDSGSTDIFIYNGFDFRATGALLTNFHLPCSTLLMLVSAFGGHENVMRAYQEAVDHEYRFFSYGDAMLII